MAAEEVGIPRNQKVYGTGVQLVPPAGRARKPVPDEEPCLAEDVLAERPWRRVRWRHGTKGPLAAKFAATRVRVADGAVGETTGTCRARRHGWSASGVRAASASTTSAISNLAQVSAPWPPPSRRAGYASRRTSSLRESWG